VNSLAPEHLRGRYNALVGLMWGVAGALGAPIAGLFFQFHAGRAWTIVLAAGAILGGIGLTTMRRVLTPEEDGRVLHEPA
jgi:MFS family permease